MTGRCGFCNDVFLDKATVKCEKCGILHHEQCWEANGGVCTRYGCGNVSEMVRAPLMRVGAVRVIPSRPVLIRHSGIFQSTCCVVGSGIFFGLLGMTCNISFGAWYNLTAIFSMGLTVFLAHKTGDKYY